MRRKQNVIIFSAGESVRNGVVPYIEQQLEKKDIRCFDWRALFKNAHDAEHIALLPSLSKKIPTFDFALILAEGVDKVVLRGNDECASMRDNVIFELGLCVMGLGVERVILLAEESVRIPEDLLGVGKMGVEYITFASRDIDTTIDTISKIIEDKVDLFADRFTSQLEEIISHINVNADLISPMFIGAAVSSAEAYFLNFIVRLLENTDKGFSLKEKGDVVYDFPEKTELEIVIPNTVNSLTRAEIADYYSRNGLREYVINDAGTRGLFFHGSFDEKSNRLVIVDIPTSITASYMVVNSVLNIDSDEDYDICAEERFVNKEMDVYAFALNKLLDADVADERLSFIKNENKKKDILRRLKDVSIHFVDITG